MCMDTHTICIYIYTYIYANTHAHILSFPPLIHCYTLALSLPPLPLSIRTHANPQTPKQAHTYTQKHKLYDTRGAAWVQVLCKIGGKPLLMLVDKDGDSCLFIAAYKGHTAVVEVRAGGGRQQEAGGRVSAATAHGTWCRGCRQHTATRGTTLQHTAARCCSVRSS